MVLVRRFLLMIQFLTTIPLKADLNATSEDYGKGLVFAPLVGLLIGSVLAAVCYALNFVFPIQVSAVLVMVVYILLTGGLHLDGLGDTFDGLFSNRPKEKILEIMRDSRVGTNAVLAIGCILLLNVSLLGGMNMGLLLKALLLMPVAGRAGSLIGSGASTYARSGEGLGKSFIDFCGATEVFVGLIVYMLIFLGIEGAKGLLPAAFPPVTAFLLVKLFSRKIGGATGDILGAVCELNQTLFLVTIYMLRTMGHNL